MCSSDLGAETIAALASNATHGDQSGVTQHTKMLGDGGASHAKGLGEAVDGLLAATEQVEQASAGGLANGGENVGAQGTRGSARGEAR